MGLDMYLTQKHYVKNWNHMRDDEKHNISILKGCASSGISIERICYVETEEICWRKSNAIHKWFVDNVQNGRDECQTSYVSTEDLEELLSCIVKVLDHKNEVVSDDILPTQSGFFFGDTVYDEWYYKDLERTERELARILSDSNSDCEFYYHASW